MSKISLGRNPWAFPLMGLVGGLIWAVHWPLRPPGSLFLIPALVVALLGLLLIPLKSAQRAFLLLWVFVLLGLLRMGGRLEEFLLPDFLTSAASESGELQILFQPREACRGRSRRWNFSGRLLGVYLPEGFHPLDLGVLWKVSGADCDVLPGQVYRALARFRRPREPGNPSSVDGAALFRRHAWALTGFLKGKDWWLLLEAKEGGAQKFQEWWRSRMAGHGVGPEVMGLWAALLFKDKNGLRPEVLEAFRRTGLSHLLVVSGLHFALVFGGMYFLVRLFGLLSHRQMARGRIRQYGLVTALGFCFAYAWILGGSPSVDRSLVGVLMFSAASLLSLRRSPYLWLSAAAVLLLLWRPEWLWDTGCRLSFFSVAVLIAWRNWALYWRNLWFRQRPGFYRRFGFGLFQILGASALLSLALFPLLRPLFPYVTWLAPLANLILVPPLTLGVLPGLFCLLPLEVMGWGRVPVQFLVLLTDALLESVRFLASLPGAVSLAPAWPPYRWGLYAVGLLLLFLGPRVWAQPKLRRALLLGAILSLLGLGPGVPPDRTMRVTFLDVGQGESLLVSGPGHRHMLIDGGGIPFGNFDVGEEILLPELLARGIRKLDVMVLSHPDADHLLGLASLAKRMPVEEFWEGEGLRSRQKLQGLKSTLRKNQTRIRTLHAGQRLMWDDIAFEVLGPSPQRSRRGDTNNQSLVLRLCYSGVCGLLTGDLEAEGEEDLLHGGRDLRAQWLKLGHHGSRGSTGRAFLQKVQPQLAVASMGSQNRFGFPHREVRERLRDQGTLFLRTDRDGQIEIRIQEGELYWRRFRDSSPIPSP